MELSILQWGRDQVIAESRRQRYGHQPHSHLQWGRDQVIAERAASLSYSVFKDLRNSTRAVRAFHSRQLGERTHEIANVLQLNGIEPCERRPAFWRHSTARVALPGDKDGVFTDLSLYDPGQQPHLNLQ